MMLSLFNLIFLSHIPHKALRREKRVINYRLSRGRKIQTNLFGILATRWRFYHAVIIMDEPVVTDIILATLALHNMPCNSSDKSVYYPLGLTDRESLDKDVICDSWRNNTP